MAKSEMIFMCHRGSKLNATGPIGLIMDGRTLPIAFADALGYWVTRIQPLRQ